MIREDLRAEKIMRTDGSGSKVQLEDRGEVMDNNIEMIEG